MSNSEQISLEELKQLRDEAYKLKKELKSFKKTFRSFFRGTEWEDDFK